MKKLKISTIVFLLMCVVLSTTFISCQNAGKSSIKLNGGEKDLPEELKGLKVYSVYVGDGDWIKVAVLQNKAISTTYRQGKFTESIVCIDKSSGKVIEVSQILMENDSLVVCKK